MSNILKRNLRLNPNRNLPRDVLGFLPWANGGPPWSVGGYWVGQDVTNWVIGMDDLCYQVTRIGMDDLGLTHNGHNMNIAEATRLILRCEFIGCKIRTSFRI